MTFKVRLSDEKVETVMMCTASPYRSKAIVPAGLGRSTMVLVLISTNCSYLYLSHVSGKYTFVLIILKSCQF